MEEKVKIAFFNFTQESVQRGAETFVRELSIRLTKKFEVRIFSDKNKLIRRLPLLWRLYVDPQGIQILLFTLDHIKEIFGKKYDFVIPVNGGWEVLLLRFATWIYGGKLIVSGQSGKGWDDKNNLWTFPDCFISLSTHLKNWAKKINPVVRVKYIPNGTDLNKFKPSGEKISFKVPKPIILCVGALTYEKRLHLAIEAVSKLSRGSLVIVGGGPLKTKIIRMGDELLGRRFSLVEADYMDLPKFYRGADFFTLPSPSYRSFEVVIVEAMATNLPVVVNDDSIRREIAGEAGIFVNPENIVEYSKALEKAMETKWDSVPRKQAEKFSWDKITSQYEELFKELSK